MAIEVNLIEDTNPDQLTGYLLTGGVSYDALQIVKNSFSNFISNVGDMSSQFLNIVKDRFNNLTDLNVIKTINEKVSNVVNMVVNTIDDVKIIKGVVNVNESNYRYIDEQMKKFITVNPKFLELYSRNEMSLYGGMYVDYILTDEDLRILNKEYRQVVEGVINLHQRDGEKYTLVDCYKDYIPLSISEKLRILESWETIEKNIYELDMTDIEDEVLNEIQERQSY